MKVLRLKEVRKTLKLSQTDVANAMNITQPYYSRWENGENLPDAKQILKLCKIFKCTPNDLFGIKGVYTVALAELDKS